MGMVGNITYAMNRSADDNRVIIRISFHGSVKNEIESDGSRMQFHIILMSYMYHA